MRGTRIRQEVWQYLKLAIWAASDHKQHNTIHVSAAEKWKNCSKCPSAIGQESLTVFFIFQDYQKVLCDLTATAQDSLLNVNFSGAHPPKTGDLKVSGVSSANTSKSVIPHRMDWPASRPRTKPAAKMSPWCPCSNSNIDLLHEESCRLPAVVIPSENLHFPPSKSAISLKTTTVLPDPLTMTRMRAARRWKPVVIRCITRCLKGTGRPKAGPITFHYFLWCALFMYYYRLLIKSWRFFFAKRIWGWFYSFWYEKVRLCIAR